MNQHIFNGLLQQLTNLSPNQRQRLHSHLKTHDNSTSELPSDQLTAMQCPHCESGTLRSWDSSHGLTRYRCLQCHRTCNLITGTPLAGLHKRQQWLNYIQALMDGVSVRRAAKQCGVNKNTASLWRHQFINLANKHQASHEEANAPFFLESFKGQRKLPRPVRKHGDASKTDDTEKRQIPLLLAKGRHQTTENHTLDKADTQPIKGQLMLLTDNDSTLCKDGADQNKPAPYTPQCLDEVAILAEAVEVSAHERLVDVMSLSLRYWIQTTGTTKLELAEQSGLWTAAADKEGTWRTRTLNRYLQVSKLPQNPRWRQVLQTAYFALQQCPAVAPQLRGELESSVKDLEKRLQTTM